MMQAITGAPVVAVARVVQGQADLAEVQGALALLTATEPDPTLNMVKEAMVADMETVMFQEAPEAPTPAMAEMEEVVHLEHPL